MTEERKKALKNLKTVKGQIEGILRMIDEDVYCIEISNQILASAAILKRANIEILDAHLKHCVVNAETQEEKEEKMLEVSNILKKVIK